MNLRNYSLSQRISSAINNRPIHLDLPQEQISYRDIKLLSRPRIALLLCTYQGEKYLKQQLDSICEQDYQDFMIAASDDGSTDETLNILKTYQARLGEQRFVIFKGPQSGFAANFLSLICNEHIVADYVAYVDQDDIWKPTKLSRAIRFLEKYPKQIPSLYCSRTQIITEEGKVCGMSPLLNRKNPSFKNALVQNIGGGNTMLLNNAARKVLKKVGQVNIVSHDWWTYILVSGVGGKVIYDETPTLLYRQHNANLVGCNVGWFNGLYRVLLLIQGRLYQWNSTNGLALEKAYELLTLENQKTLLQFSRSRQRSFFARLIGFYKSGIYQQTLLGQLGLVFAVAINKI